MAYTRFSFRDEEERIEFLIALPILALFGIMLYHFVFAGDSDADLNPGFAVAAVAGSDIDSDGVIDADDQCTAIAGTAANFGCPADQEVVAGNTGMSMDTDGDGVTDAADRCPEDAGLVREFGCPASVDAEDDVSAGTVDETVAETDAEMPADSDGDGIADDTDQCPQQAGNTDTGCPTPATAVAPEPVAAPEPAPTTDADSDGIFDADDGCPQEAGSPDNEGCPVEGDSDGDGVADSEDLCPQSSGVVENRGCPADSDADGLPDTQDQCPEKQGPIDSGGCPLDTDGDGVEDALDECVDVAGDADYNGCPLVLDADGDGIADADDVCPQEDGAGSEDGCPAVEQTTLESLGADISFETASATLTDESKELLDVVASILKKYPAVKLLVEGHTDNQGQAPINLRLSEQRARACTTYLARQGIAEERMQSVGYGDTQPLVPNDSEEARKRNRRVEFKLTN